MNAWPGRGRPRLRRGSALLTTTVIVILLTGISVAFSSYIFSYIRRSEAQQIPVIEAYAAEAAIEKAWYEINNSSYTGGENDWLLANASTGGTIPPGFQDMALDTPTRWDGSQWVTMPGSSALVTATVRIYDLGTTDRRYLVVAYARHNTNRDPQKPPTIVAQEFQANVSFGNFAFFVSHEDLWFGGGANVDGSVQSNRRIYASDAVQKTFQKDVKTSLGFNHTAGSNWSNTTILGTLVTNAPPLDLPSTAEINQLRNFSDGDPYYIHTANGANDTIITPLGQNVGIKVVDRISGATVYEQVLPPPSEGVIFVQGNCTIESGVQSSRWTLACMNKVTINGSITYQDAEGDDAYILKNTSTGEVIPKENWPTTTWAPPLSYEPNPNHNPPMGQNPVLGIVAHSDIELAQGAPMNTEIHAAMLSTTGRFYYDLAPGSVRANFRMLGGISSKYAPYTTNGVHGFVGSRGYTYDPNLTAYGPPHYPSAKQPSPGARWRVPPHEAASLALTPWP